MKDMDDLHFARGADAMDVDHASLDNEEALARFAFAEEIFAFLADFSLRENELISAMSAGKSRENARA